MKNARIPVYLFSFVAVLAIGAIVYYEFTKPPKPGTGLPIKRNVEGLVYLENCLPADKRADFYHLAEGSEIYPVLWLQALKIQNGKYFLEDVETLGFLPDPDNADGLPVGLTSGITRGLEALGPMSGLNCAACHVGELHYQDKRVRIDGAPNLLNTRQFFVTLIESAIATAKDPAALLAFAVKVRELEDAKSKKETPKIVQFGRSLLVKIAAKEEEVLNAALKPVLDDLIKKEFASKPFDFKKALKSGITDAQAFQADIVKDLKLDQIGDLAKKIVSLAGDEADKHAGLTDMLHGLYVKLRLLRGRAEFLKKLGMVGDDDDTKIWGPGRVDAFGSARAFLFQPGYPPLTPVSYPPLFAIDSHKSFHYDNNTTTFLERNFGQALGVGAVWDDESKTYSLQPKNLRTLESLSHLIAPPKWPEAIFGKIDQERVKRGQALYQKFCAECHEPEPTKQYENLTKLPVIGTDPKRATMFAETLPNLKKPFPVVIKATLAEIKQVALKEFDPAEQKEILAQPVTWCGPGEYSARSIKGAWATAPYLHNGSVPTLDDLLKPAKDRPKTFYVGSREYDVAKLGYVSDEKMSPFDTTKLGNSNAGHEGDRYGTSMSADDRKDLLEFLKTQ